MSSIAATSKANGKTERTRLTQKKRFILKDWFFVTGGRKVARFLFSEKIEKTLTKKVENILRYPLHGIVRYLTFVLSFTTTQ